MDTSHRRSTTGRDLLLLTLAAACWGIGTVISKRAVDEFPPLFLFPIQLTGGLVALALVMRRAGLPLAGSPTLLGRLGILNPGLAYALGLIGLTYVSASLYVLLWALEPLMILVLAGAFLGERIRGRFVLLSAVAAAGMAVVVYQPATSGQWPGVVLTIAGVGCCAAYTVIVRRWVGNADSTAQVVLAQLAYALAFAVALALAVALAGGLRWPGVSLTGLLAAIVSGLLYYAAAYWFYLSALRSVPAALAATSFYLIPIFGLAGSFVLLGERLQAGQWVGIGVVIAAVLGIIRVTMPPIASPGSGRAVATSER